MGSFPSRLLDFLEVGATTSVSAVTVSRPPARQLGRFQSLLGSLLLPVSAEDRSVFAGTAVGQFASRVGAAALVETGRLSLVEPGRIPLAVLVTPCPGLSVVLAETGQL